MRQGRAAEGESLGAAVQAELLAGLDAAVGALPGRYREVVALCYLEGLSQSETSRRLGVPLGTVAVYCQRGLERLRGELASRAGAGGSCAPELTAEGLGALLTGTAAQAASAVPAGFLDASLSAAKGAVAAAPPVAALVHGVLQALFWQKMQLLAVAAAAVLALGVAAPLAVRVLSGGGAGSRDASGPEKPPADGPAKPGDEPRPPPAPETGEDVWEVDGIDSHMEGTWAGGTDMLLGLTEQLIRSRTPTCRWPARQLGGRRGAR